MGIFDKFFENLGEALNSVNDKNKKKKYHEYLTKADFKNTKWKNTTNSKIKISTQTTKSASQKNLQKLLS